MYYQNETIMNKKLIKDIKSLQQVFILGMISLNEYNERFNSLMVIYNKEYKKAYQSIKH